MARQAPRALRGRRLTSPSTVPALSVLLPVRDGAEHIHEAIQSIDAQTFEDFEVVAVDDGSRDSTLEVLSRWARSNPRVVVVRQPRSGIARALDRCLRMARAPLVARMDADDVALPERFALQREALEATPGVAVLGSRVTLFPRKTLSDGMKRYERWLSGLTTPAEVLGDLFVESPIAHPSVMARREALVAVGGYRDVDGPEDYDLWLRLAEAGFGLANDARALLRWRDRPDRATRRDPRYRARAIRRLKLRHLLRWRLGGADRVVIWGAGPLGKGWARALRARGLEIRCFVDVDPKKLGRRIQGAPVVSPEDVPPPGECPILASVGAEGAREQIRAFLAARGYREPEQLVCVQ